MFRTSPIFAEFAAGAAERFQEEIPQPIWRSVNPGKGVRVALLEVLTMPDAKYFAGKAQRCRELLKLARVPEVIEQLRVWATEFEAEAQNSAQRQQRKRGSSSMLRQRTRA